jgi:hypothetical protein
MSDLDFGQQVICRKVDVIEPTTEDPIYNEYTCKFRDVGHIGTIVAVFPEHGSVLVAHHEDRDGNIVEFLTAYRTSEIEKFDPPRLIEDTKLAKAITNFVQITRD